MSSCIIIQALFYFFYFILLLFCIIVVVVYHLQIFYLFTQKFYVSMAVSLSKYDTIFVKQLSNKIRGEEKWQHIDVDLQEIYGVNINEYNALLDKSYDYASKIYVVLNGDMVQSEQIFNDNFEGIESKINSIDAEFNKIDNQLNNIEHEIITSVDMTHPHIDALLQSKDLTRNHSVFDQSLLETFHVPQV